MKSALIAFEGIDGSGKTTQINLLKKYLESKNITFEVISFPRYEDNLYGKLIRRYLNGEFGSKEQVNPYLIALAYASDRNLAKPLIESSFASGKLVILNRYVAANKAHLAANLKEGEREEFMGWIDALEYQTNNLPKENLNILLNVGPKAGFKNVQDGQKDIHEDSLKHLEEASKIYNELSKAEQNWQVVECMERQSLKDKEAIHKLVIDVLDRFLVD